MIIIIIYDSAFKNILLKYPPLWRRDRVTSSQATVPSSIPGRVVYAPNMLWLNPESFTSVVKTKYTVDSDPPLDGYVKPGHFLSDFR